MLRYDYEVLSPDGSVLSGTLHAENPGDAARQLERKGLVPLALNLHRAKAKRVSRRKLSAPDVSLAFHELATLLTAGVPIADAVESQRSSGHHPRVEQAFGGIATGLRRGDSFSECLARSQLPVPDYFLQLARAGEMTGRLAEALGDGVRQMDYEHGLRVEMRNALIYPSILVVSGVLAVLLIFLFVVPKFASLLQKSDQLPWLAWAVLAGGQWTHQHAAWLLAASIAATAALVQFGRRPEWRLRMLERAMALPLVGAWLTEAETARWSKVLGTLLGNRVPLIQALELAAQGVSLPQRKKRLSQVTRDVRDGLPLSDALQEQDALTATGYNLVRVGERAGELPAMLLSLAHLYDQASAKRMKRLLIVIEPLAILIIGAVIGTIILGVILAITSANDLAI
jgi:general secretion pathway protein F